MSHLGELLSAHVDGELSGVQLDRVNAHLAACADCRAETSSLRRVKYELRSLAELASDTGDLTGRLLAMTTLAAGVPVRSPRREHDDYELSLRRRSARWHHRAVGRPRGRSVLLGALSLAAVGVVGTAFGMGGGGAAPGPRVKPQLEAFDRQAMAPLFVERGTVAADMPGWRRVTVAGRPAGGSGHSVTWTANGFVYTVIADAPPATATEFVAAVPSGGSPGVLGRLSRGFKRLGQLVDPLAEQSPNPVVTPGRGLSIVATEQIRVVTSVDDR